MAGRYLTTKSIDVNVRKVVRLTVCTVAAAEAERLEFHINRRATVKPRCYGYKHALFSHSRPARLISAEVDYKPDPELAVPRILYH